MESLRIEGFELERVLGEGAQCRVYLAREQGGLQRPVALKVFPRLGERQDFQRELTAVRRVEEVRRRARCESIVQALASGETRELAWIAFELCEGGSLAERVEREGPLPWEDALALVLDAADALELVHGERLFHRDVKPQNLLLGGDGRLRVADFGLARPLDGTLTAAGSPAFAAPEVIAGALDDGRRADVYSLAATLAYLLTGQAMLAGRPDVFALERRGVPRPLQGVIVQAMSAEPAQRPGEMATFAERLRAARGGEDVAPLPPEPEPELTAEERAQKAWDLSEKSAYAAAALTLLPVPGGELVGTVPIHVGMVIGIGQIYGVAMTKEKATALLARVGATVGISLIGRKVAATALKIFLPGVGGVLTAPLMFASTLSLGRVARLIFEHGGDLSDRELKQAYQEGLAEAKQAFDPRRMRSREARSLAEEAQVAEEEGELVVAEPSPPAQPEDSSPLARLERLHDLLQRGLIEQAEFDAHKRRILDAM